MSLSNHVISGPHIVIPGTHIVIPGTHIVIPGTHIVIPGLTRNLFSSKNYCILKFFYDLCHWYDE